MPIPKMVKHIEAIRRRTAGKLFDVFDHFVGLVLKGLNAMQFN